MLIQETWIDRTRGIGMGESVPYEPFTDNIKKLFRSLSKEYGRCVSSVYIDGPNGKTQRIGWVFLKRRQYDDCSETYLAETWVTLYDDEPMRSVTHHYHALKHV